MNMYAVFDQKAQAYGNPVFFRTHGEATRVLEDEILKGDTLIAKHPEDFVLFFIGHFDEVSGVMSVEDVPLTLGRASDLAAAQVASEDR